MFPRYLSFIKGMVDSDNLPLNVSREILQQDRTLSLIKKKLARKVIGLLQDLSDDKIKYEKFWELYGPNIKYGVSSDSHNRVRLSRLLRYQSSKTDELTGFEDYLSRMQGDQKNIYYIAGESLDVAKRSPFIERLVRKGYEVLYMVDPIDEWMLQSMPKFDNKWPIVNVAKEGFKLDADDADIEKVRLKETSVEYKPSIDFIRKNFRGRLSKGAVSQNLIKTPSAISGGPLGYTATMERLMRAQPHIDHENLASMKSQRILELNPRHSLVKEMNKRVKVNPKDPLALDIAEVLYETASLQSGFTIDDPAGLAQRVVRLMKLSLNLGEASDDTIEDDEEEGEEEGEEEEGEGEEGEDSDVKDEL
jgi:heat shock protein beta